MAMLDAITDLDWQDPKTLGIVGGGTALVVGFMWLNGKKNPPKSADAIAAEQVAALRPMPVSDGEIGPGVSGVPGWVGFPDFPTIDPGPTQPTEPVTNPVPEGPCGAGKVAVWRSGALRCESKPEGAYAGGKCPPGYTPIASGKGYRCAQLNDEFGKAEGPTSYIPTDLLGRYEKGNRSPVPAGVGGSVINPTSRPLGVGAIEVQTGDSLMTIARKAYGNPSFWPRIAELNGARAAKLRVGERLTT